MHIVVDPKIQPVQPLANCTVVNGTRHTHAVTCTAQHHYARHKIWHRLPCTRLVAKATTKSINHSDHALGPAPVDRILACLVYIMPICEGLLRQVARCKAKAGRPYRLDSIWLRRLAVVSVRIAQYNLLDWLLWADLKGLTIRPEEDVVSFKYSALCSCSCACCASINHPPMVSSGDVMFV